MAGNGESGGDNGSTNPTGLLVMRHAKHAGGQIVDEGREQIRDVAGALAEWCSETGWRIDEFKPYKIKAEFGSEVVATANLMERHFRILANALESSGPEEPGTAPSLVDELGLSGTYGTDKPEAENETEETKAQTRDAPRARLIVLNEPQASIYVKRESGAAIALRHAEVVMLDSRKTRRIVGRWRPYRACWTMAPRSPGGDPLVAMITKKIESKMRTAGVLGGLITTLLTFVLTRLFGGQIEFDDAAYASLLAFGASSALFFVAMFFYDSLTMPSEFWVRDGRRTPGWLLVRPPSATSRVLQQNMVRVWTWIFLPAVLALGVGLVALFLALDGAGGPTTAREPVRLEGWHLYTAGVVAAALVLWCVHFRPRVGSSD